MKNPLYVFLFLLLPFANTVYFIQDLQETTLADFTSQLGSWTADTGISLSGINSGGFPFLQFKFGFPASQVHRSFSGLDDHHYASFSLRMYINGACSGEILEISFDGVAIEILVANSLSLTNTFFLKGGLPHSGNSIEVSIASKLTASCPTLTFGIRAFSMNFFKTLESTEQKICHTLTGSPQLQPVCDCVAAQRGTPCKSCSTGCSGCDMTSLGVETCSRCDSASLYEWNGEICETCESKCAQCAGNMGDDCSSCLDGYFKYADGTCAGSCPSPFKKTALEGGFIGGCVVPCGSSEWLYGDLSCKDYCDFKEETDSNGIKRCKSPCDDEDDYYYEEKGVCQGSCGYPNEAEDFGGIKICSFGLDEEEVKQIEGMSKAVNGVNAGSDVAIKVLSFLSSSDSSSIFMGAFSKMLQYIKYMKIVYPAKVELMLEMTKSNSSTGSFASKMMRKQLDKFPERKLPERFVRYGAKSSFFVNYWPSLFILLTLLSVTILFLVLSFYLRKLSKVNQVLSQIICKLKWNIVLLLFCGDFGDIVFFTALELTSEKLNSFESVLNLVVCFMINLFAFWVMAKILIVNFEIRKAMNQKLKEQDVEAKWGSYKTLFTIYKDQSYFQQIFMFIFILRISIFNALIGYFFNYPLFQAILITLVNLSMLFYLILKRPMKAVINFIQQIVLEGFLLVFNVCLCILAGLDHHGVEAFEFRDSVGEVMVVINIIVPIVSVGILAAKLVILGIEAYKEWKAEKLAKKGKVVRIELPRERRAEEKGKMEIDMANQSNILDMSSSNASFMNTGGAWLNFQDHEGNKRLNKSRWDNPQISNGISGQLTSYFPDQQQYQTSHIEQHNRPTFSSPARQFLKKQRIKRNRPMKSNDSQAKNKSIPGDMSLRE